MNIFSSWVKAAAASCNLMTLTQEQIDEQLPRLRYLMNKVSEVFALYWFTQQPNLEEQIMHYAESGKNDYSRPYLLDVIQQFPELCDQIRDLPPQSEFKEKLKILHARLSLLISQKALSKRACIPLGHERLALYEQHGTPFYNALQRVIKDALLLSIEKMQKEGSNPDFVSLLNQTLFRNPDAPADVLKTDPETLSPFITIPFLNEVCDEYIDSPLDFEDSIHLVLERVSTEKFNALSESLAAIEQDRLKAFEEPAETRDVIVHVCQFQKDEACYEVFKKELRVMNFEGFKQWYEAVKI